MKLSELCEYKKITIQCHDNPDPDALASGWALQRFFESRGIDVRFIYSGRFTITKSNLLLMLTHLGINIEYLKEYSLEEGELLVTTDCQYGQGNVTCVTADSYAVVDHHNGRAANRLSEIRPSLGSCSTLAWWLMKEEGYDFDADKNLCTALYYGLMTDTGNFSEIHHPLDKDMQEALTVDKSLVNLFCNSNISLDEMVIAGDALTNYRFLEDSKCGIIQARPCDPNILGFISDLALQVDKFNVCISFCEVSGGYKLSVRSCDKEVRANEFAEALTSGVGSGGGHIDKAGGFISKQRFEECNDSISILDFLDNRVIDYFNSCLVINADEYDIDVTDMKCYSKKPIMLGYADPKDFLENRQIVVIRTLEGDVNLTIEDDFYIMIGLKGEVYPIRKDKFEKTYDCSSSPYTLNTEYLPTVHCESTGEVFELVKYAKTCIAHGGAQILAKKIDKNYKIFNSWYNETYMLGRPGDYVACKPDDHHDIYIVAGDIFDETYEEM